MLNYSRIAAAVLALSLGSSSLASDTFKDVEYLYKPEGKDKPHNVGGKLTVDPATKHISFVAKKTSLDIAEPQITSVLYERTSKPRYAAGLLIAWPLLFTKEKKHFLTFQYKTADGVGQYAIFHLDKGDYRRILAATEAALGRTIERSEER